MALSLCLGLGALTGCGEDAAIWTDPAAPEQAAASGTLRLQLVSTQGAVSYRLKRARLVVSSLGGARIHTVEGDLSPDAAAATATILQGVYRVELESGWVLEKAVAGGTTVVVQAALTSTNPQEIRVNRGQETQVNLQFQTTEGVITLGDGRLSVSFSVSESPGNSACEPGRSCGNGQTCLLADQTGRGFCADPGPLAPGAACEAEQCQAGSQCLSVNGGPRVCTEFCSLRSAKFGCNCVGLPGLDEYGICGPLPSGACDLFGINQCPSGQSCQYTGGSFGTCGVPGTGQEGQRCFGADCAAGLTCRGYENGGTGQCYRLCRLDSPYGGYSPDCSGYCDQTANGLGVCR